MEVRLTGHGVEQFSTDRVVGRRVIPADLDFLADLHADAKVMELHDGERAANTTDAFLRSNVAHWRRCQFGMYVVSAADRVEVPLGRAGLRWNRVTAEADEQDPTVDVSAVMAVDAWGRGLGTEIFRALITIGLELGVHLTSATQARHTGALTMIERSGFVFDADFERRDRSWIRYRWPEHRAAPGVLTRVGD